MAKRGWFSGDTHVHRTPAELPNVMLAEDLNVAFPLSHWGYDAHTPPPKADTNANVVVSKDLVKIDTSHGV